jgi:peptidoglycan/LPS O-acetylase OafA/YrhL
VDRPGFQWVDVFLALSGFFSAGACCDGADTGRVAWPVPEISPAVRRLAALVVVLAVWLLTILIQPGRVGTFADEAWQTRLLQSWELANPPRTTFAPVRRSVRFHIWSMSVQGRFYIGFGTILVRLSVP